MESISTGVKTRYILCHYFQYYYQYYFQTDVNSKVVSYFFSASSTTLWAVSLFLTILYADDLHLTPVDQKDYSFLQGTPAAGDTAHSLLSPGYL